tara:strand:- start:4981 stop:15705 length:10725 start_codon:yes stop_codon:yes gene_type:complete
MSIKKLFGKTDTSKNYLSNTNQKDVFDSVESSRNVEQVKIDQDRYVPQIDYSKPENFARFGSARLYYKSAMNRILDYYPYDGSDAEINEFYNQCLDIERYILKHRYPRTTGYITFARDGYAVSSVTSDGYGVPTTNEYIELKGGPGTGSTNDGQIKHLTPSEYNSKFQNSNIYDDDIYQTEGLPSDYGKGTRTSNLRANFDDGVTVEFWLKTGSIGDGITKKQVVFDMWNNEDTSSTDYGRITIELTGNLAPETDAEEEIEGIQPFLVTVQSGAAQPNTKHVTAQVGSSSLQTSFGDWNHYAVSMFNSGSDFCIKLYVNGNLNDENIATFNIGELKSKNARARIGALITSPSGSSTVAGAGRLSGSMDEFRYWKVKRSHQEIGRNWRQQIRGGVNTDIANTTLGVYYKFNEGITGTSSVDSVVLDYAGRVTNGIWTGYGTNSRNTGSAIVSASAASKEYHDPIIYENHPDVKNLSEVLEITGTTHDYNNNSSFLGLMPGWILDEDSEEENSDLKYMSHIVGTYFDKLYLQISEVPKLRHLSYPSASHKPIAFAEHLPQSLGLLTPEIFVDSTVLEKFANRNEDTIFENDLTETKNLIYTNLYNNLSSMYKSKGTEKSIRNVLRCFNIDDKLLRLNVRSNNNEYILRNNLQQRLLRDNCLNLNHGQHTGSVIYQKKSSTNAESAGYILGGLGTASDGRNPIEDALGFTVETNIIFPFYSKHNRKLDRKIESFNTSSLFGMTTVDTGSTANKDGTSTIFVPQQDNHCNFNVYAVRDVKGSNDVYFKLTASLPDGANNGNGFALTSSTYSDVYNNELWNLSFRIKPKKGDRIYIAETTPAGWSTPGEQGYYVVFTGYNPRNADLHRSFTVSASIDSTLGQNFVRAAKRLFVGAHRNDLTGAVVHPSDVLISSTKYWAKYIDNNSLLQHALDPENIGISGSYQHITALYSGSAGDGDDQAGWGYTPRNRDTLALNWNFLNVTSSDNIGQFIVQDFSSGSQETRDNFGELGMISGYQYDGLGYDFSTSSSDVVDKRAINTYKFIDPEQAVASDMVQIFSDEDVMFQNLKREEIIPNFIYSIEKSLYASISEEMLSFFAGVTDFHNLIGAPVNRYRDRYKDLEKLRQMFFRRVSDVAEVEKYIEYYKWFDDSITEIIEQMVPASSDFIPEVKNVIESHVLERNKYQSRLPMIDSHDAEVDASMGGIIEQSYNWLRGSSPVPSSPRDATVRPEFWRARASASAEEITSGDIIIDSHRDIYRDVIYSSPRLSSSALVTSLADGTKYTKDLFKRRALGGPVSFTIENPYANRTTESPSSRGTTQTIKGGVNFEPQKSLDYTFTALKPGGPVSTNNNIYVPTNVLLALTRDRVSPREFNDETLPKNKIRKFKRVFKVQHGRDWESGIGYKNVKSSIAFPFNIMSSSVESGFNKEVVHLVSGSIEITNLHNDVYGPQLEKPMQGPFTERYVGGHQSRHIPLNEGSDSTTSRPEAWKILLGTRPGSSGLHGSRDLNVSGAIGMVGPDYPPPDLRVSDHSEPYPHAPFPKAYLYRDAIAKRPVNIKNIRMVTSSMDASTSYPSQMHYGPIGNYREVHEIVSIGGRYNNPRQFVENQPTLPDQLSNVNSTTNVRTILDVHREQEGHFKFVDDYDTGYLTGTVNKSVIVNRFSAPGGIEVQSRGYQDFKGGEYSPYNCISYRNLSVKKPSQGPSGSESEPAGGTPSLSRVRDIHDKDYGLYSHLARHTARFGRDSLHVSTPGATYEELPGFHKIHRNNKRIVTRTETITPVYSGSHLTNTSAVEWPYTDTTPKGSGFLITGSTYKSKFLYDGQNGPAQWSVAMWVWPTYMRTGTPVSRPNISNTLLSIGYYASNPGIHIYLGQQALADQSAPGVPGTTYVRMDLRTTDGNNNNRTVQFQQLSASVVTESWNHIVVVFSASAYNALSSGSTPGWTDDTITKPSIYVNGVSQVVSASGDAYARIGEMDATQNNFRNYAPLDVEGTVLIGTHPTPGSYEFTGAMTDVSFFSGALQASEVTSIYNSGVPCDLTASTYASASIVGWYRMGDGTNDSETIGNNDMFTYSIKNQVEDDNHAMAIVYSHSSNDTGLKYGTGGVPAGCTPTLDHYSSSYTFNTCESIYDNYNIQHVIPRTDKQYRWITQSLSDPDNLRYAGRQNTWDPERMPFFSASTGFESYYNFVTQSDITGSPTRGDRTTSKFQSCNVLNLLTLDPVHGRSGRRDDFGKSVSDGTIYNTLGHIFTEANIANNTLSQYPARLGAPKLPNVIIDTKAPDESLYSSQYLVHSASGNVHQANTSYLNLLLTRRGYQYGWTWKKFRQQEHPILRHEKKLNVLRCVTGSSLKLREFRMPPLSLKGRPSYINFDAPASMASKVGEENNITLKAIHTNETNFFNETAMNEFANVNPHGIQTPLKDVIAITKTPGYKLNWILYSQNVFPSMRNEFLSRSATRVGYLNEFWRDSATDRLPTYAPGIEWPLNSFGISRDMTGWQSLVSQSLWPLDPPEDFLTRTTILTGTTHSGNINRRTKSGELQNTWWGYKTITPSASNGVPAPHEWMAPSALYARKHVLGTPTSVAPSYAPQPSALSAVGHAAKTQDIFATANKIQPYAGEAAWDAPDQSGIFESTGSFVVSASAPWYDNYDDFRADLKLIARGFNIVPEYRISEHVESYLKYGINPYHKFDVFEIPGTNPAGTSSFQRDKGDNPRRYIRPIASSGSDFYIDYSNTDFWTLLGTTRDTVLQAEEIKMTCEAAIKYNPYRGFYPADATIDLVSAFSRSFADQLQVSSRPAYGGDDFTLSGRDAFRYYPGWLKPIIDPLFSPGILYNSIKSGIAVDYPIITDNDKVQREWYGSASADNNWALSITGCVASATPEGYNGGMYWDKRLPFETIINPQQHMAELGIVEMESHPSMSFAVTGADVQAVTNPQNGSARHVITASMTMGGSEKLYELKARNFFGAVPNFFLEDGGLTSLRSKVVPDDLRFPSGSVYMGRIWIEPSHNGKLYYHQEYDHNDEQNGYYGRRGVKVCASNGNTGRGTWRPEQFPSRFTGSNGFKQTYTMYNRVSAFGPDCAGRPTGSGALLSPFLRSARDSFSGYNGAFTPPYFDGMARVDLVFRPHVDDGKAVSDAYSLERILAETKVSYRRFDSGYRLKLTASAAGDPHQPVLLPVESSRSASYGPIQPSGDKTIPSIYDGYRIDVNSMQLSSAFNLFGVERVLEAERDQFGNPRNTTNKAVGKRWVIQPKWETPMADFTDASPTQPTYGATSTPVGMWHQFGKVIDDPSKGIKFGITDIPESWLKFHYEMTLSASIYNDYDISDLAKNSSLYKRVKSLSNLLGFDRENSTRKLGVLKKKQTVWEAVVAIPYVIDEVEQVELERINKEASIDRKYRKKFIQIPPSRVRAALEGYPGTTAGDSTTVAGQSIRNLERLVREKYVFPPQFDFVRNEDIDAIAMYVFEFKYEFDKDDLNYMWQNLAPRNYKKASIQKHSVAHNLSDNEMINKEILKNDHLRWMVFKVKQRGMHDYYDMVADQIDGTTSQIFDNVVTKDGFEISYNWPYDYLSIVELVRIDVDVLLK